MGKLSKTKTSWKNQMNLADTERPELFYPKLKGWLSTGGSQSRDTFTGQLQPSPWVQCSLETPPLNPGAWPPGNGETPEGHSTVWCLHSGAPQHPSPDGTCPEGTSGCAPCPWHAAVPGTALWALVPLSPGWAVPSMLGGSPAEGPRAKLGPPKRAGKAATPRNSALMLTWVNAEALNKWESYAGGEVGRQILFFWCKPSPV